MSGAVTMKPRSLSPFGAAVRRWVSSVDSGSASRESLEAMSGELARLRESETRLRQVTDVAPVLLWMSDSDARLTYLNKYWLDFTGRPAETELGLGWLNGVHHADRDAYRTAYDAAFLLRQPLRTELRLRRSDGEYRWLLVIGAPMRDDSARFIGYVGTCLDITESKVAEHALATVSGRLIEAQEQERSRLARELHDDINQRLALLAIELERLRTDVPHARNELVWRIDSLRSATLEISRDVQALSHELHSSKLDFLGLVAAVASYCREFSELKNIAVHFTHHDVPPSLSRDISLCLFRVLQEASHNVAKHSGARRFEVELRGTAEHAYLTVRDTGKGFDPASAKNGQGLGLISMRERLGLVGGTLSIRSALNRGAELVAEVPLSRTGFAAVPLN